MADKQTYSSEVPNYTAGPDLWMEIGERDGHVYIRLSNDNTGDPRICLLDPQQAGEVRDAIATAISLARR